MVAGTDAFDDGVDLKYGYLITGGSDRKIRFWDVAEPKRSFAVSGGEADEQQPTLTISQPTPFMTLVAERAPRSEPSASNAAAGRSTSGQSTRSAEKKSSKSTVMSLNQQLMRRTHVDAITDIALLESPYGLIVSADRSGCTYVFQ